MGVVTLVEAENVVKPVAAPVSSIVVTEFWISLPVVPSNRAMALSVDDAGPVTSPPAFVVHVGTPAPLLVSTWPAVPAKVNAYAVPVP